MTFDFTNFRKSPSFLLHGLAFLACMALATEPMAQSSGQIHEIKPVEIKIAPTTKSVQHNTLSIDTGKLQLSKPTISNPNKGGPLVVSSGLSAQYGPNWKI